MLLLALLARSLPPRVLHGPAFRESFWKIVGRARMPRRPISFRSGRLKQRAAAIR